VTLFFLQADLDVSMQYFLYEKNRDKTRIYSKPVVCF